MLYCYYFCFEIYLRFINSVRSLSAFLQVWFCPVWFPSTSTLKVRPDKPHGTPVALGGPLLDTLLPAPPCGDGAHRDLLLQLGSSIERVLGDDNTVEDGRHCGGEVMCLSEITVCE